MALPSTGGTWAQILEPDLLPTAQRKGIITDVLIGDYLIGGVPRNLAATAAGLNSNGVFTPFAADGTLRQDLLWNSASPNPSLSLHHIGLLKDGWTFTPNLTVDKTHSAQTIWSTRNDVTEASGDLMFTAQEHRPLIDYLRMDLPLVDANGNNVVPDIGTSGYSVAAPGYQNLCERTIIAIGIDSGHMFSITIPRCSQSKLGKSQADKKNVFDLEFTYEILLDAMTQSPYIVSNGGLAWAGLGGAPVIGTITPTPQTGLKVQLVFPLSGNDIQNPTFAATKTTGGTTTALTLQGSPSITGGVVTLIGTSLTASTSYTATVTVTGDNGATASATTASFTSTAS